MHIKSIDDRRYSTSMRENILGTKKIMSLFLYIGFRGDYCHAFTLSSHISFFILSYYVLFHTPLRYTVHHQRYWLFTLYMALKVRIWSNKLLSLMPFFKKHQKGTRFTIFRENCKLWIKDIEERTTRK